MLMESLSRRLAFHGALLLFLGMAYGLVIVGVMTGALPGTPQMTLGAHLNALFGAFWLWGASWSVTHVRLGRRGLRLLYGSTLVGAYANWLIAAAKAIPGAWAIQLTGDRANDLLFLLRIGLVVVPSLVGPGLLAWGLRPKTGATHD